MRPFIFVFSIVSVLVLVGCENLSQSPDPTPSAAIPAPKPAVHIQALQPKALAIVQEGLRHDNAYLRTHAAEIVAEANCRQLMTDLLNLLGDSSTAVRFAAAVAIGDMRCVGYEKHIEPLLKDSNQNVQIAAAYTMTKLNHPARHETLRRATESPDQTVRANAALLLGKMGNRDDLELLYGVLYANDSLEKVRMQAVESIARLGDNRMYRSKLWALLISKYADDRVMGIRGMGALGTAEAKNAILTMLQDDVLEVRLAAAEQLGRLGDERGEEEVYRYFRSNPNLNRVDMANNMAIKAIGQIGSKRLTGWLPDVLASQSEYNRLLGAEAVLLLTR